MEERAPIRVGVLGVGAIAQVVHLPILSQLESMKLVAVCDVDRDKARAIAARFGIRVHDSDDDVFRADDLDALVICTPSHLHEAQAVAALESGKHVLVEKPLAIDAAAAERVIRAAEAAGRVLMVAMNNRFRPDTMALRPFAEGGELGELFLARGEWLNRKVRVVRPTWRHRKATAGGGAMMDLGVQMLDLSMWMLGFPRARSVCAHIHRGEGMEVEDAAAFSLRLETGAAVSFTVSWSLVAARDRHTMRLLGTRGSGAIAPLAVYKEGEAGHLLDVTPAVPPGRENLYTASYRQEMQTFLETVHGDRPLALPHEQIELMRLITLAYRSAEENREVDA
ncbi:MAG: Gfo/Idh/MocA family protein [Longimicrobiales bacterium]